MLHAMDTVVGIVIKTDASAAKGIASRRGLGKVRHIDVTQLWVHDHVANGTLNIVKIGTLENLADALTKHVDGCVLKNHIAFVRGEIRESRHHIMPRVD